MRCKSDFLGRLCAYEPDALVRFGVGRRVGSGRSGTVYESARGCVIKVASAGIEFWDEIDGILSYLKDVKNPSVMDVKEYHFIGSDASDVLYCLISELSPDYLITIGASGKIIAEAARQNGMNSEKIISFDTSDEARKTVQDLLQPESLVLIKGSQGKRMEKITAEIMAEPMRAHELLCRQHGKWLES
jgi:hypothetical protein